MFTSLRSSILLLTSLLHLSRAAPADEPSPSPYKPPPYGGSGQCPATFPFTSYQTTAYLTTWTTTYTTAYPTITQTVYTSHYTSDIQKTVTTVRTDTSSSTVSTVVPTTGVTTRYCPASPSTTVIKPPPYACTFNTNTCIRPACVYLSTTTVCNDPCCKEKTRTITEQQTCATACPGGCNTFIETVTTCVPPLPPSVYVSPTPSPPSVYVSPIPTAY